jgi:hypothetical protein
VSDPDRCIACGRHFDEDDENCPLEQARRWQARERSTPCTFGAVYERADGLLRAALGPSPAEA